MQIEIHIDRSVALPDNNQWINRFEIKSETSSRIYVVAQHKVHRYWGCSCPGWITNRKCKHLTAIGLPNRETPYEPKIIQE